MQQRSFQFDNPEREPFPLEINGESVMCVAEVDGHRLLEYMAVMNNPNKRTGEKAEAMTQWFRDCVQPQDYGRFLKIVNKYRLDIDQLGEISGYLSDIYSSVRPTGSAHSSAGGQAETGDGSEDASS